MLEDLVWKEIEAVLSKPEVLLAGIETVENGAKQANFLEQELVETNKRLEVLDREQDQLLQWALKGFPEGTIARENKRINQDRAELNRRKSELEKRIEATQHVEVNIEGIKKTCELVSSNLTELSFENKRLALEALNIKVWVDGENITVEGAIPIADSAIVSTIW